MNGYTTVIDALPGQSAPQVQLPGIQNATARSADEWIRWGLAGIPSDSGVTVSPSSALQHSPVWQAINILSGDVAQLDFMVQRVEGDRKTHKPNHRVDWTIGVQPNNYQTTDRFYENMMHWALGWGNAVAAIDTSEGDIQLLPLPPDTTKAEEIEPHQWMITTRIENKEYAYFPSEVVHLPGLTRNGFWGLSAVKTCQNRLGHGMALLKHGNSTFKNGAKPSGVLKVPQGVKISPEARGNLRQEWQEMHGGSGNAGNTAVLYDGMEWEQLSMSNEDAQWAESTELDLLFVAGVFMIPPYKLGYMKDSSVRSNLEAQQREYYNTSLSRWVCRIQKEFERKLFRPAERRGRRYRVAVDISNLTQGTRKEQVETVALEVRTRLKTRNEGREALGMNPVEGGDEFENPAIDTSSGAAEDTANDSEVVENALRKRGTEPLLLAESQQLRRTAGSAKNFIEWLDKFTQNYEAFAESFIEPLADVFGFDWRELVQNHAENMKKSVLLITDFATPSDLAEQISEYTEQAPQRAAALARQIMQGV